MDINENDGWLLVVQETCQVMYSDEVFTHVLYAMYRRQLEES